MVIFEVFFALICKWLEQLFCCMSIMGSLSRICGTFKVKSLFWNLSGTRIGNPRWSQRFRDSWQLHMLLSQKVGRLIKVKLVE